MIGYTHNEALEAIRNRDEGIALYLLRKNFRFLRWQMIISGIEHYSPDDMFNDIMYTIYLKFDQPDFVLTCDIDTYFMGVFENQRKFFIYRQNHEAKDFERPDISEADRTAEVPEYEKIFDLQKLHALINKHLKKITKACRRIMNLFLLGFDNKEVSRRMKRSYDGTRTLKKDCRKTLEQSILEDPEYDAIKKCEETNNTETK